MLHGRGPDFTATVVRVGVLCTGFVGLTVFAHGDASTDAADLLVDEVETAWDPLVWGVSVLGGREALVELAVWVGR
jgi:hypothetical protein